MVFRNKLKAMSLFAASRVLLAKRRDLYDDQQLNPHSVIATAILFLYFKLNSHSTEDDPGVALALPTMLQQAELAMAVITATMIPCVSLFGVLEKTQGLGTYGSGATHSNIKVTTSITLRSMSRKSRDQCSNDTDTIGLVASSPSAQRGTRVLSRSE